MGSGLTWSQRANWGLLLGGVVMAVGAVGFFVTAATVSLVRIPFLITGALFVVSSVMMLRLGWGGDDSAKEEDALRSGGVHARATITAITPTGTQRRGRQEMAIQLRLEVPGKPPMLVTKTDLVRPEVVEQLTVGRAISVHSDPNNTLKIAIDWDNLNDVNGPSAWGQPSGWPQA